MAVGYIALNTHYLFEFNPEGVTKIAKFGVCRSNDEITYYTNLMTYMLTVFLACFLTAILNTDLPHHQSLSSSQAYTRREQVIRRSQ